MAAAAIAGAATPVEAASSIFWPAYPDYYEPYPQPRFVAPRVRKSIKKHAAKTQDVANDARKPQGPLIIAISIDKQVLKIYDVNGAFAETPISTGMRGHSTPMGVFSVIEKQKYHRSNIYSGAPMPYMQRITWSGIALHAGVLPGYPASHGCIRMPMDFAVKMWGWTRMGARVVITPGDLTPESFSHPLLATQKISPTAAAPANVDVAATGKSDKAAMTDPAGAFSFSDGRLELKSTVGHDLVRPANQVAASPTLRERTHTADASSALSPATIIDAPVASNPEPKRDVDPVATKSAAVDDVQKRESPVKAEDIKTGEQAVPAASASPAVPDVNKDQARLADQDKAAAPSPQPAIAAAPKRSGPIAVFVSKKDGKLYVRQNLAPLFDVPVTIAPGDRPLGTHVFTAQTDKNDGNLLHWSVVSLPFSARGTDDETASRRRTTMGALAVKAAPVPDSAAQALDRLTIPADAMARIAESLSTGSSIVVSDQSINAGETGKGTDFIVSLR